MVVEPQWLSAAVAHDRWLEVSSGTAQRRSPCKDHRPTMTHSHVWLWSARVPVREVPSTCEVVV